MYQVNLCKVRVVLMPSLVYQMLSAWSINGVNAPPTLLVLFQRTGIKLAHFGRQGAILIFLDAHPVVC
jgi:hypothetical protein